MIGYILLVLNIIFAIFHINQYIETGSQVNLNGLILNLLSSFVLFDYLLDSKDTGV